MADPMSLVNLCVAVDIVSHISGERLQPVFLDARDRITDEGPDDYLIDTTSAMDWGALGVDFLEDAKAWQGIADLSNIIDPFTELVPGSNLRVPTVSRYQFKMLLGDE